MVTLKTIHRFPTEAEIRQRAQEIYLARGGQPGHAIDDWLQAEYEWAQLPVADLAKLATPKSKRATLAVAEMVQVAMLVSAGGLLAMPG